MQEYKTITISASNFPASIKRLSDAPSKLYLKGNEKLLEEGYRVGIVGARKFTPYGRQITDQIARKLAQSGITTVSGLALGVDSIAHKASVAEKVPTIAVLPCGIDSIYPSSHKNLALQILQHKGLIISEYPENTMPLKHQFIARNRIISALCDVLIITEAAEASGSLHTANFAIDMGIQIMAVPGNIDSPYSRGTNKLIQNGAYPLLSADDVMLALGLDTQKSQLEYLPETQAEKIILDNIKTGRNSINEILLYTDMSSSEIQTTLTMLEIKGILICQATRWYLK